VHGFSPPEIVFFAQTFQLTIADVIRRLIGAGLRLHTRGGAEISGGSGPDRPGPHKMLHAQWLEVMETAHTLGLRTTATMMFGHVETRAERLGTPAGCSGSAGPHRRIHRFHPLEFPNPGARPWGASPPDVVDYLKTLAVSRLVTGQFSNVQVSWVTQGA